MKLLSKSEIATAKAADRQKEIAEGMKLASRVDSLRETAAAEETALSKFRTETLSQINKETREALNERDTLRKEVKELRELKAEAQKPLDEEFRRLEEKERVLQEYADEIKDKQEKLSRKEVSLNGRERDLARQERRAEALHTTAEETSLEASRLMAASMKDASEAKEMLRRARVDYETSTHKIQDRVRWVTEREEAVLAKEESLRAREIEIEKEWQVVKDRAATIERTIKRNNK